MINAASVKSISAGAYSTPQGRLTRRLRARVGAIASNRISEIKKMSVT